MRRLDEEAAQQPGVRRAIGSRRNPCPLSDKATADKVLRINLYPPTIPRGSTMTEALTTLRIVASIKSGMPRLKVCGAEPRRSEINASEKRPDDHAENAWCALVSRIFLGRPGHLHSADWTTARLGSRRVIETGKAATRAPFEKQLERLNQSLKARSLSRLQQFNYFDDILKRSTVSATTSARLDSRAARKRGTHEQISQALKSRARRELLKHLAMSNPRRQAAGRMLGEEGTGRWARGVIIERGVRSRAVGTMLKG